MKKVNHYEYDNRDDFLKAKRELGLVPATIHNTMGPNWVDIHWAITKVGKKPYKVG